MDSLNVDWEELNKEKKRQVTYNGQRRQEVSGQEERQAKNNEAMAKMMKIKEINDAKKAAVVESKVKAQQNQQDLSAMIKGINDQIAKNSKATFQNQLKASQMGSK